jgi:uncharacterized repeat protein (TIGR03803 family)
MSAKLFFRNALPTVLGVVLSAGLATSSTAQAQTPTVIYTFSGSDSTPRDPNNQSIAQGRNGNLYFTTCIPLSIASEVFDVTAAGTLNSVYTPSNCSYGLTLGTDGNIYSTTGNNDGGSGIYGSIYKVTPGGTATTLYTFTNGADGSYPYMPPIEAANGIFYGVTSNQAVNSTAYSVTSSGTFTTLHTFTGTDGQNVSSVMQASDGNFYGASVSGGSSNNGVIFRMSPAGTVTVLHNFAGTDGSQGYWPLMQAKNGDFYGTTLNGGTNGAGVLFRMTLAGVYTVLYNFPSTGNGATGEFPYSGLIQATNGLLYGITSNHQGPWGWGSLYSFNITTATLTTLYSFAGTAVGGQPSSPLVQMTDGLIYGTTYVGGDNADCTTIENDGELVVVGGCGTVFSLNIGAKPFVSLVSASGKVGSKIGILGQGFSVSSVVKFNGVTATTVSRAGTTFLLATVPAGASNGSVTVTTGTSTLTSDQKFIVHNSWSSGAGLPTAVQFPVAAALNGKIYVVGGTTATSLVGDNQVYTPGSNTWTTAAAIPAPVYGAASAVVSGVLYVIGGYTTASSTASNLVQAYNPTTNIWTTKTNMPTARGSAAAVLDGGSIYVIGGNGTTQRLNTVEKFNPATDTWTTEAPLLVGKSEPSAAMLGATIVAVDGYTAAQDTGDNEGYTVSTNKWKTLKADPTPRNASCYGTLSGALFIAGGGNNGTPQSLTESFNATADSFTSQAAMPQAVIAPGSAVANGLLYCVGGSSSGVQLEGTVYNNLQIYQP